MSGTSNISLTGEAGHLDPRSSEEIRHLEAHRPVKVAIIVALGVVITLGNLAVVMVISSAVPGWSRNSRYFLLSLTGADSAFGLVVMPLNLSVSLLKRPGAGPDPLCHAVAFFNASVYSTCMYTLASISLERYLAVFYPLQYRALLSRRRALCLIALAWAVPPVLLAPVWWPRGVIQVRFSAASLVCNPAYSSNPAYSLALSAMIFFPCSALMTFCNLRLWAAAKRHRLKLRTGTGTGTRAARHRPDVASRVLVPVMTVYYTCWTPCMVIMIYNAMSGSGVPEWVEFVAVWLPTSNGFLNCIFYFWINKNFRRKFHLLLHKLCLGLCPSAAKVLGCARPLESLAMPAWNNNNSLQERSSSVSSTCTLLTITSETYI